MPINTNNLVGLIYGCGLADALGLQVEGRLKEEIKTPVIGMPTREMRGIPLGDWTDDTDQLILLMDTLSENNNRYSPTIFARKLQNWARHGFSELGDLAGMGMGQLTARVISKDNWLTNPYDAAYKTYVELGANRAPNGAIMRCGIIACSNNWIRDAVIQAETTHADSRCIASSVVIVTLCRYYIHQQEPPLNKILTYASKFVGDAHKSEWDKYLSIYTGPLESLITDLQLSEREKTGYTLKALGCGIYAARHPTPDFKTLVLEIVNEGGDTDTNAAVLGQVLGARVGYQALPSNWLKYLKYRNWLNKKIINLIHTMSKNT